MRKDLILRIYLNNGDVKCIRVLTDMSNLEKLEEKYKEVEKIMTSTTSYVNFSRGKGIHPNSKLQSKTVHIYKNSISYFEISIIDHEPNFIEIH